MSTYRGVILGAEDIEGVLLKLRAHLRWVRTLQGLSRITIYNCTLIVVIRDDPGHRGVSSGISMFDTYQHLNLIF